MALGNQFRLVDNFREEEIEGRASGIKQFCNGTIDEEAYDEKNNKKSIDDVNKTMNNFNQPDRCSTQ